MIFGVGVCFATAAFKSQVTVMTRAVKKIHFTVVMFWTSGLNLITYSTWLFTDYTINNEARLLTFGFDPYWKLLLVLGFSYSV